MNALDAIRVPLAGTTLIEASAGTGKTYTIATLYLRLLLERRLEVSEILVVTYTRAATAELRDRIRRRLVEALAATLEDGADTDDTLTDLIAMRRRTGELERDRRWLKQALRDFDEAAIFTIHGFCQRTLTEHAFESRLPFELKLVEQETPLLREIAEDYWARVAYAAEPELVLALQQGRAKPDDLQVLAGKAVRNPRMPVLPYEPEEPALPLASFYAIRDRASAQWKKERGAILAELNVGGRLNARSHSAALLTRYTAQLDGLGSASAFDLPDGVAKLSSDRLRKATLTKYRHNPPAHAFFELMTELVAASDALRAAGAQRVLALRRRWVDVARVESSARRRERGVQSFDDLLEQLSRALEDDGGEVLADRIRKHHPAALIDEFQDTDPLQYGIFQRLYAGLGTSLFLIGDPKQAIYAFRGADVFAYTEAARAVGDKAYTLDVSFRADPRLLQATNTLFGQATLPFLFPEIRFDPVRPEPNAYERMSPNEPALQLLFVPSDARTTNKNTLNKGWGQKELPELIAGEITDLLRSDATIESRQVQPRDIAVLCRTNAEARATQAALSKLRVPTVLDGDNSVFEAETAEELSRVLWAVAQPMNARRLSAALASSLLNVDGESLYRMREEEVGLELWIDRFARLNQLWHERGFIQMLHQMLEECAVQANLLLRSDGERRLTDLLHLSELLHEAAMREHLGPLALLQWFGRMQSDPEARTQAVESAQVRLEHDEHALKLTTIHRSKGLEYPIVFCPFLWSSYVGNDKDVRFHDRDDQNRIKLDLGSQAQARHAEWSKREELAESLRILYVALTRAKHRCYVVWGRFQKRGLSALGYLLHQGPGEDPPAPDAIDARLNQLDDGAMLAELQALCNASANTIGVREVSFEAAQPYRPPEQPKPELQARAATRILRNLPRLSSFSRLTADPARALEGSDPEGLELGETADTVLHPEPVASPAQPVVLHDFPAGSRPGTLIHSVYEHIDFMRNDPDELGREVERFLMLHRLDLPQHREALVRAIDQSLQTPLDDAHPPLTLGRIPRKQRVDELEFTLHTPESQSRLSAARLAAVLERHGAPAAAPDYPERLRNLRMLPPTGFFKGYIDLVFQDGERFYLADYKSNWLGNAALDYSQAQLVAAMSEHHYFLQYHLYCVALHRYLALRVPAYDYDRHFGGVYYLFVRGMSPQHPRGTGVFFDRPELALLEAFGQVLGTEEPKP